MINITIKKKYTIIIVVQLFLLLLAFSGHGGKLFIYGVHLFILLSLLTYLMLNIRYFQRVFSNKTILLIWIILLLPFFSFPGYFIYDVNTKHMTNAAISQIFVYYSCICLLLFWIIYFYKYYSNNILFVLLFILIIFPLTMIRPDDLYYINEEGKLIYCATGSSGVIYVPLLLYISSKSKYYSIKYIGYISCFVQTLWYLFINTLYFQRALFIALTFGICTTILLSKKYKLLLLLLISGISFAIYKFVENDILLNYFMRLIDLYYMFVDPKALYLDNTRFIRYHELLSQLTETYIPIFTGTGLGMSGQLASATNVTGAHSGLIGILNQTGVINTFLILLMFMVILKRLFLKRRNPLNIYLFGTFVSLLVMSLFEDYIFGIGDINTLSRNNIPYLIIALCYLSPDRLPLQKIYRH